MFYSYIVMSVACLAGIVASIYTVKMYYRVENIADSVLFHKYKSLLLEDEFELAFELVFKYVNTNPLFLLDVISYNKFFFGGLYIGKSKNYNIGVAEKFIEKTKNLSLSDDKKNEFISTIKKVFLSNGKADIYILE